MQIELLVSWGIHFLNESVVWKRMGSCNLKWGLWKDLDETGVTEPKHSDESSLPVEEASLSPADTVSPPPVVVASPLPS